jgi:hypothetical protein
MRKLFYLCHLKTKTYTGNFTFSIKNLWFSGQVFDFLFTFFENCYDIPELGLYLFLEW